jgi:quercetin dioxygenase-like cupin family protein
MTYAPSTSSAVSRVELMRREIPGTSDREAVMFLISAPPGAAAPVHTHPGIGIGYVLEGVYESQYQGEELKRFTAGEPIYDLEQTPHLVARNGSTSKSLRLIMTFVLKKGEPTILPLESHTRDKGSVR